MEKRRLDSIRKTLEAANSYCNSTDFQYKKCDWAGQEENGKVNPGIFAGTAWSAEPFPPKTITGYNYGQVIKLATSANACAVISHWQGPLSDALTEQCIEPWTLDVTFREP